MVVFRAIFTKLCMNKIQYVGGMHMTSCKHVTSFMRKAAISFSGFAEGQRSSIKHVFGMDFKEHQENMSVKCIPP